MMPRARRIANTFQRLENKNLATTKKPRSKEERRLQTAMDAYLCAASVELRSLDE